MQRQYLSIDIGGTEIKSALIDHSGNIFEKIMSQLLIKKKHFWLQSLLLWSRF